MLPNKPFDRTDKYSPGAERVFWHLTSSYLSLSPSGVQGQRTLVR